MIIIGLDFLLTFSVDPDVILALPGPDFPANFNSLSGPVWFDKAYIVGRGVCFTGADYLRFEYSLSFCLLCYTSLHSE